MSENRAHIKSSRIGITKSAPGWTVREFSASLDAAINWDLKNLENPNAESIIRALPNKE